MAYNFKQITIVPTASEFIDIILSKTQRKTPTVVHPGYKISRIRTFYSRKVKYTQQNYHDKLTIILGSFPKLEDVHPFYAELMNVLYDRDHYKIALGQLSTARKLIDGVGRDYLKLLKYGDSLYRCKQLKKAALGRMCTIIKRQASSLAYLERVRQHLSRLPSIDPQEKTLILTGHPNVGKSSFMKWVTRADVDVQPYPFTTKSLYIGHMDYRYQRWQVMDTPGILDHSLEERNTIEMQAITALAHLKACIIYILDISEECGNSVTEQVSLFNNIRVLFSNKPVVLVLNKIDTVRPENLPLEVQQALKVLEEQNPDMAVIGMSSLTGENVTEVKTRACDKLLQLRVEQKILCGKVSGLMNQLTVAYPVKRDCLSRPPVVPATVLNSAPVAKKKTLHQCYIDECEDFYYDLREEHLMTNEDWRFDNIPEIMDGKNIADFVDPDILERLELLEQEELIRVQQGFYDFGYQTTAGDKDITELALKIRQQRRKVLLETRQKNAKRGSRLPRRSITKNNLRNHLLSLGIKLEGPSKQCLPTATLPQKRGKPLELTSTAKTIKLENNAGEVVSSTSRLRAVPGSKNRAASGLRDETQHKLAVKLMRFSQRARNKEARKGEGDRTILNKKPKHLFSGKRSIGKTDRR
ncbi:GTP-binding protein 4-like [Zophobas morio]|uniref:GTP-binding protein 4-like n=1 Tax=Zophobas morio TaxID=2755281 RepID=UPI003083C347